jgi:hypothetical protein
MTSKKRKRWTEEEIQKFIHMYPNSSWDDLINEFQMSKKYLTSYAYKLGIKREQCVASKYTQKEDQIIINGLDNGQSIEEIQQDLPWRSVYSIKNRSLKIYKPRRRKWTSEEEKILTQLYSTFLIDDILEYFPDRSRDAIIIHAGKLGLKAYSEYNLYTNEEYDFIKKNYLHMSDEEMGRILGRSRGSIKNHRNEMGLYRIDKNSIAYEGTAVYVRRHNVRWKKDSMKKCNFKCVITGERFDEIHHLVSLNTILNSVYQTLNLNPLTFNINIITDSERELFLNEVYKEQNKYPLGVCLTKKIHMQFHNYYGYGNNTAEQFYEFIDKFYPNTKLNIV